MVMSEQSIKEYSKKMRARYSRMTGKMARTKLLDELVAVSGWERKHANKVLLGHKRKAKGSGRRGAPRRYSQATILALKNCWLSMDQPCGKRMKDMLPIWLPYLEEEASVKAELGKISAATIDRLLKDFKVRNGKRIRPPKRADGVKALVEIRAESWETSDPGWTEVDTVAHSGGDMSGSFIWTLTSVDVASGWTELRAVWNRGQHESLKGMKSITLAQPFDLQGVDSDNGGEFLNYHLYDWLEGIGVKQTRSRPYFKNDQAYVEEKNYTHVRQFLGYDRIEHQELQEDLNELLKLWSLWKNLYCVTMKQKSKNRIGGKQVRSHHKESHTPAQRLLSSGALKNEHREQIAAYLATFNPFELRKEISRKEDAFWNKRAGFYRDEKCDLVDEGLPPLRSGQPSSTRRNKQKTKTATVSQL